MNFPDWLYTIDILFFGFVLFSAVRGLRRGLSGELAHILTVIIMLSVICFLYPSLSQGAARIWSYLPTAAVQTALIIVMVLTAFLLFCTVRAMFKQLFKARMDAAVDHMSGCGVGALRGAVIGLAVISALSLLPSERLYETLSEKSVVGGWVCNTLTPWLHPRLLELPVFDREEN